MRNPKRKGSPPILARATRMLHSSEMRNVARLWVPVVALLSCTPYLMGSGCGSCTAEIRNLTLSEAVRCVELTIPYRQRGGSCEAALTGTNRCSGELVFPAIGGRPSKSVAPGQTFDWGTEIANCSAGERCVVDATLDGKPVQFAFDIAYPD